MKNNIFLQEKPIRIMFALKKKYPPRYGLIISKEADCTYIHTQKILVKFQDLGLVTFEKNGRTKIIKLTKKGEEIYECLEKLSTTL